MLSRDSVLNLALMLLIKLDAACMFMKLGDLIPAISIELGCGVHLLVLKRRWGELLKKVLVVMVVVEEEEEEKEEANLLANIDL